MKRQRTRLVSGIGPRSGVRDPNPVPSMFLRFVMTFALQLRRWIATVFHRVATFSQQIATRCEPTPFVLASVPVGFTPPHAVAELKNEEDRSDSEGWPARTEYEIERDREIRMERMNWRQ